jgi:hypothetical protein
VTNRLCRHQGCAGRARATLTFSYSDRTAVLGPLSPTRSVEGIDLCVDHCDNASVPRGWDLVRLPLEEPGVATGKHALRVLADAVRAAAGVAPAPAPAPPAPTPVNVVTLAERGHLRVVADPARQSRPRRQAV